MKIHPIYKVIRSTLLLLLLFIISVTLISTSKRETSMMDRSHPYPRLGMWWLDAYTATINEIANYDLLLQEFDNDSYLEEQFKEISLINPEQINLKPLSPSERQLFLVDWETEKLFPNPEIVKLPSDFFLLQSGALLTASVDESTTTLKLDRMTDSANQPLFHLGGEVAIGKYESAKIISINWESNSIEVERGYVRAATEHNKGEKVASHIRFWPGSWVMNVTDACPKVKIEGINEPVNYIGYYFNLIIGNLNSIYYRSSDNYNYISTNIDYDGFIIDRFEDKESWLKWVNGDHEIELDLYHDFRAVSAEEFDASWKKGTDQLYHLLREKYTNAIIIRNNPLTDAAGYYDGQVYETNGWKSPSNSWWEQLVVRRDLTEYYAQMPYLNWFNLNTDYNPLVLFEVYEDEGGPDKNSNGVYMNPMLNENFVPNYKRMRFSLTTALLGDGYYSYEINTNGHGSLGLMWFDEYDNVGEGTGYLGFPVEKPQKLETGAYVRYFDKGMVVVNPTDATVQVSLPINYRKINGKQDPEVNTGELLDVVVVAPFDGIILLKP